MMRQVKVQPLTYEAFAPYGSIYDMKEPKGYALCGLGGLRQMCSDGTQWQNRLVGSEEMKKIERNIYWRTKQCQKEQI